MTETQVSHDRGMAVAWRILRLIVIWTLLAMGASFTVPVGVHEYSHWLVLGFGLLLSAWLVAGVKPVREAPYYVDTAVFGLVTGSLWIFEVSVEYPGLPLGVFIIFALPGVLILGLGVL